MSGVLPNRYDRRDYSYERTFGAVDAAQLPKEYNADLAYDFPDQNKDGYPNGCTGYTQSETGQDEYGIPFDAAYVYRNTLTLANLPPDSPCQIRDSFKAVGLWGLQPRKGGNALDYKRGRYFDVDKVGDYFDGVRSALWLNRMSKRTVSVGTPWHWPMLAANGIMKGPKKYAWPAGLVGHNYKICGWKTLGTKDWSQPYLIVKAHCGAGWGDGGYGYMSREVFNKLMNISGTFMYTQRNWIVDDIPRIKLDLGEFILSLLRRWRFL
jgi:hypothetical protein